MTHEEIMAAALEANLPALRGTRIEAAVSRDPSWSGVVVRFHWEYNVVISLGDSAPNREDRMAQKIEEVGVGIQAMKDAMRICANGEASELEPS